MIDAGIELVEHPARVGAIEKRQRALDQIVEIEQAARSFQLFIAGKNLGNDGHERQRFFETGGGLAALAQRVEPLLLPAKFFDELGTRVLSAAWSRDFSAHLAHAIFDEEESR